MHPQKHKEKMQKIERSFSIETKTVRGDAEVRGGGGQREKMENRNKNKERKSKIEEMNSRINT